MKSWLEATACGSVLFSCFLALDLASMVTFGVGIIDPATNDPDKIEQIYNFRIVVMALCAGYGCFILSGE